VKGQVIHTGLGQPAGRDVFQLVEETLHLLAFVDFGDTDPDPGLLGVAAAHPSIHAAPGTLERPSRRLSRADSLERHEDRLDGLVQHPGRSQR
jgi:hypothetical protein